MSLATAGVEIPELAEKHGFALAWTHRRTVAYFHAGRREGFTLTSNEDGGFERASWAAPTEYAIVVEKRAPGQINAEGRHLVGDAKRRPVGVGDVRPELIASPKGLDIGYMNLKRRIKNPGWRTA